MDIARSALWGLGESGRQTRSCRAKRRDGSQCRAIVGYTCPNCGGTFCGVHIERGAMHAALFCPDCSQRVVA